VAYWKLVFILFGKAGYETYSQMDREAQEFICSTYGYLSMESPAVIFMIKKVINYANDATWHQTIINPIYGVINAVEYLFIFINERENNYLHGVLIENLIVTQKVQ
jgi:hypothetical protein